MTKYQRKLSLLAVKFGPVLLALTCSAKILLLGLGSQLGIPKNPYCFYVHIINLFLDLSLLGGVYIQGKAFGYCWKHQSLCRIALWGYIYYAVFLFFQVPFEIVEEIVIFYSIFTIVICIIYENIK